MPAAGAGGLPFLAYAIGHCGLGTWQLLRHARLRECRTAGSFMRLSNVFFSIFLVCNNVQLFAGSLGTPGRASENLLRIESVVHEVLLPLYILSGTEVLVRALATPGGRNSKLGPARGYTARRWRLAGGFVFLAAVAVGAHALSSGTLGGLTIETDGLGVKSWTTPNQGPPIGVVIIALYLIAVGAIVWNATGYCVLFGLQLLDLVGQGGASAAKSAGFVSVISNLFEVVFNASMCLAEAHFFGQAGGAAARDGDEAEGAETEGVTLSAGNPV